MYKRQPFFKYSVRYFFLQYSPNFIVEKQGGNSSGKYPNVIKSGFGTSFSTPKYPPSDKSNHEGNNINFSNHHKFCTLSIIVKNARVNSVVATPTPRLPPPQPLAPLPIPQPPPQSHQSSRHYRLIKIVNFVFSLSLIHI